MKSPGQKASKPSRRSANGSSESIDDLLSQSLKPREKKARKPARQSSEGASNSIDDLLDQLDEPRGKKATSEGGNKNHAPTTGTLRLAAKPSCRIFLNGRDTGKDTPQKAMQLPAGTHRITLINNEFGIKESFSVRISAGKSTTTIKDFSRQIN